MYCHSFEVKEKVCGSPGAVYLLSTHDKISFMVVSFSENESNFDFMGCNVCQSLKFHDIPEVFKVLRWTVESHALYSWPLHTIVAIN